MARAKTTKVSGLRRFLARTPRLGTKKKPSPLAAREVSPYYWWWQYLRRNSDYIRCCERGGKGKCASLYKDFGDVRSDDFRAWWYGTDNHGARLFAEPVVDIYVKPLNQQDKLSDLLSDPALAVVAVNLELVSRREIKRQFDKWLKKVKSGKPGRPDVARSKSKYPLHRNFSSKNLKRILEIYDAVEAANAAHIAGDPRKTRAEIGKELKVIKWASADDAGENTLGIDAGRSLGNVVSKLYVKGQRIIKNTSLGLFPNEEV